MTVHTCPDCGLEHGEPERRSEDPMIKVAKIEADRDVEVAKISAGVSRDEMMREIEALRAELTVRREEPPVAETTVTEETIEPDPPEEPVVVEMPDAEPEPEQVAAPPEAEHTESSSKKKPGWWDAYA